MTGFSIIVCCYNSAAKIEKTICCLRNLKTKDFDFEVIIVDNNSSDNTYETAVRIAGSSVNLKITILQEHSNGKANALITGAQHALYDYLLICDDDNWLNEDYLTVAYEVMRKKPRIGILGGRGVIRTEVPLPGWYPSLENAWAVGKQAEHSGEVNNMPKAVWGAGMVIRKEAWDLVFASGFKRFLTGRQKENVALAGEDTELCIVVSALGYKIFYEDGMRYQHDLSGKRLTWKSLKKLWEGFSRSYVYFEMYNYSFSLNRAIGSDDLRKNLGWSLHQTFIHFLALLRSSIFLK